MEQTREPVSQPFRFHTTLRVRYSEVDWQGHVFNGVYLTYLDVAMTEYLRALGFRYPDLVTRRIFDPAVVKATLEFMAPACFDEELDIGVHVADIGRTSLRTSFGITKTGGTVHILRGEITYVNYDTAAKCAVPVPPSIREAIEQFESGDHSK